MLFHIFHALTRVSQDQTVQVAEALELKAELRRLRDENSELKKRISDFSGIETAKKKAEVRVEQLEQKVCSFWYTLYPWSAQCIPDGGDDPRESGPKRKRTQCYL